MKKYLTHSIELRVVQLHTNEFKIPHVQIEPHKKFQKICLPDTEELKSSFEKENAISNGSSIYRSFIFRYYKIGNRE